MPHCPAGAVSAAARAPTRITQPIRQALRRQARRWREKAAAGRAGHDGGGKTEDDGVAIPARFGPYSTLEVIRVRQLFDSVDLDGSGTVELQEMLDHPEWSSSYGPDHLVTMFEAMDQDRSGDVTLAEVFGLIFPLANRAMVARMIRVTASHKHVVVRSTRDVEAPGTRITGAQRAEIGAVFAAIDTDGDGVLGMEEIRAAFANNARTVETIFGPSVLDGVLQRYDDDGSNGLDMEEFTQLMMDSWLAPAARPRRP